MQLHLFAFWFVNYKFENWKMKDNCSTSIFQLSAQLSQNCAMSENNLTIMFKLLCLKLKTIP
jgi:hypothetical protein